jgi:hypothetical protein
MVAMCHSAGPSPMFVDMRNPAWSTCYSRWPPVPASPATGNCHRSASLPPGFVVLEASEAAFRTAVPTHPDADSLATRAFLSALARTAGDRVVHSPRAAVELAA